MYHFNGISSLIITDHLYLVFFTIFLLTIWRNSQESPSLLLVESWFSYISELICLQPFNKLNRVGANIILNITIIMCLKALIVLSFFHSPYFPNKTIFDRNVRRKWSNKFESDESRFGEFWWFKFHPLSWQNEVSSYRIEGFLYVGSDLQPFPQNNDVIKAQRKKCKEDGLCVGAHFEYSTGSSLWSFTPLKTPRNI